MKSTDYIVIQAPMITELHLKGNDLLLFALITGFTKDENTRFRGSLTYISEWLQTSKSAAARTVQNLQEAGLIEKYSVMVGKVVCNEYVSRYNEILEGKEPSYHESERASRPVVTAVVSEKTPGIKMRPVSERDRSQNGYETGLKMITDRSQNENQYYIDNIYNNNSCSYCSLSFEQQQEEQQFFFKYFFFRNAANPKEEVERFIGHNSANGWTNKDGKEYDTPAKRQGLAALWQFQSGDHRVSDFALSFLKQLYDCALRALLPDTSTLLDTTADVHQKDDAVVITCKKETRDYIENNIGTFRQVLLSLLQGRKLGYSIR